MVNERHPDRKKLQAWLWVDDVATLKKLAKDEGLSVSELLKLIIAEAEEKRKKRKK